MKTTATTLERAEALEFRSLKDLKGYKVMATDGEVGVVDDFYFDDESWTLRYFVVNTGTWLSKRRVLVSPAAFADSDGGDETITTVLTRNQVEDAPEADLAKPVSRSFEAELHQHFNWPLYWTDPAPLRKGTGMDSHLRSVAEVLGYHIHAQDGEFGHVEDMIVEESSWTIRLLAIDTRNWLPGRKVVVSTPWIKDIRWPDATVVVDLSREAIKKAPKYDPSQPVNRTFEERLVDHYGRPRYWV